MTVLIGCTTSDSFGGIWRGVSGADNGSAAWLVGPQGQAVGVEVVLGEYGPDIAGLVRYYRDGTWLQARAAEAPDAECACALIHGGRVSGDSIAFTLQGCVPGASPTAPLRMRAVLRQAQLGATLTLTVDDTASPLHGRQLALDMQRSALASEVSEADLACAVGLAPANTASGL